MVADQLRCERCKAFIGEDCLEGHDGTFFGSYPDDDGYTGLYYCAPGKGCNRDLGRAAFPRCSTSSTATP